MLGEVPQLTTQPAIKPLTLEYVKTIGITNNQPIGRGFHHPVGLVVSKDRRIFVLNRGLIEGGRGRLARVGVCNFDEEYLDEFGSFGSGDGQFEFATAIAIDSRERIYISDEYLHRISVFDTEGQFLSKWGTFGSGDGEIDGPSGLAFDSDDNVYLVDQNNHRVQKFTSDGRFLMTWGEEGSGEGQLNMPWGITLDSDGNVYVADWRNDRIQKFTSEGAFLAFFRESGEADGQLHRPSDVAVDGDGNVYVADWGNERVQVFGPGGEFLLKLRGEATVSKWAADFFEANPDEKRERDVSNLLPDLPSHLQTPYHISSQSEPYFWGPVAVVLDDPDHLYVVEHSRHRFQVYRRR